MIHFADIEAQERERRYQRAMRLTTLVPLSINRPAPVLTAPEQEGDTRPIAPGRDPCPRCETRGDLGCAHFRPAGSPGPTVPYSGNRGVKRHYHHVGREWRD